MRIISADSHVLEPHDLWTSRLKGTPFADRAPKMIDDGQGGHPFAVDGLFPFPIGLAGAAGKPSDELSILGNKAEELRAGGWDAVARLEDMDTDGIAAEVLYPSVGMTLAQSTDLEYQLACIRAYNDWLVELCAAGAGRLVGLAMIPVVDIDVAVAEVARIADA
jgi:predicted TIM-barrel fold metal-dependent hydrolase